MSVIATSRLLGLTQIQTEPVKWPAASVGDAGENRAKADA